MRVQRATQNTKENMQMKGLARANACVGCTAPLPCTGRNRFRIFAVVPNDRRLTGLDPRKREAIEAQADFVANLTIPTSG